MKKKKYKIILFCNKKRKKLVYETVSLPAIRDLWYELKTEKKPRYIKEYGGKRNQKLDFELALVYPDNRWAKKKTITKRDDYGRLYEAGVDQKGYRLKEMVPYWREEKIFDYKSRKGNFIFVKDVTTNQRKNLYIILKKKGYDSQTLFRHYSY